ncbi:MAG TPA: hypothetical protein V6D27_09765 [Vampirovibrionales bacterium]
MGRSAACVYFGIVPEFLLCFCRVRVSKIAELGAVAKGDRAQIKTQKTK